MTFHRQLTVVIVEWITIEDLVAIDVLIGVHVQDHDLLQKPIKQSTQKIDQDHVQETSINLHIVNDQVQEIESDTNVQKVDEKEKQTTATKKEIS